MLKFTYESKLDLKRTIVLNTKQWVHDHGHEVTNKVDRFFETQAGSR